MRLAVNPGICVLLNAERITIIMAKHQEIQHPIPILMEDPIIHTAEHPFCSIDPSCPCHDDPELIAEVHLKVEQGLLTPDEAARFVQGKQV